MAITDFCTTYIYQGFLVSKYQTCDGASTCANGLTCQSGGCVDTKSLTVDELYTTQDKPNNVYVVFSLWDKNCNPAVISPAEIAQRFVMYDEGIQQSATESFNGLIATPKVGWTV